MNSTTPGLKCSPVIKTHPVIECIFKNNREELNNLLKDNNVDQCYPCEDWNDHITPLIAAIVKHNTAICSDLLSQNVNPNIPSEHQWTPLHYVSLSNAPLDFVNKLLEAKADPNGSISTHSQKFTPLQTAAIKGKKDVVKRLISAKALVTLLPRNDPECVSNNMKIFEMIAQLASSDDVCSQIKSFLDLEIAVFEKTLEEVFTTFNKGMLLENPQSHLTMIEILFTGKAKYSQACIKWLKENTDMNIYIAGAASRFPNIPKTHVKSAAFILNSVFCTMDEISNQQALAIVPHLLELLHLKGKPDIWKAVLQALYMITQKTKGTKDWDFSFLEKLCKTVAPFLNEKLPTKIRLYTYGIFANLVSVKHAANILTSVSITSVPEDIQISADMQMNDKLKEALRGLQSYFSKSHSDFEGNPASPGAGKKEEKPDSASNVKPPSQQAADMEPVSKRWKKELKELSTNRGNTSKISNITYNECFLIRKGDSGTEVFLGLRDDNAEVAIKRMPISKFEELKNEQAILQHPKLDHSYIVRYVYATDDKKFGYLCLQLCEYNLKEYFNNQKCDSVMLKELAKQVLESLRVLHCGNPKILHRDLKPENVLIDVTGRAKLADFGISRQVKRKGSGGLICVKAEETLEREEYTSSDDIQFAGKLIYYILTGGRYKFGKEIKSNTDKVMYSLDHIDVVATDLIQWMINKEPEDRPKVEECLSHPFFWASEK